MNNYIYKSPLEQGYKQFKLTKKQHNKLFKNRLIKWCDRYEYYYNNNEVILHRFGNWKAIIIQTILFPVYLLLYGYIDIKDEFKEIYNQKKYGAFLSDSVTNGSNLYKEIIENINNKEG